MSGSKQKLIRRQQREEGVEKRQVALQKEEHKKKKQKIATIVISAVLVVVLVVGILFSSNLFYHNFSAVTIGDTSYNAAELSFFYNSSYLNFMSNGGQYFGPDPAKPLSSQDYTEDKTWEDFFVDMAVTQLKEVTVLCDAANEEGFVLSEDDQKNLDAQFDSLSAQAENGGFPSVNAMLAQNYGKGVNEKVFKDVIQKVYLANAYRTKMTDSFEYTDEELLAYYEENKENYEKYSFIAYYADGSEDAEEGIKKEDAMAEAKEAADTLVKNVKSQDDFASKVAELSESDSAVKTQPAAALNEVYKDWVVDTARKAGDTTVIEGENGYYAIYWIEAQDAHYSTVSARHILVNVEPEEQTQEQIAAGADKVYTEEAKAEALKKAKDILAEWKKGEATEESFAQLATLKTEDPGSKENGGLYEEIYKGQMVPEFNDWIFNPARKPGDTGIVYNEGSYTGYHVIYFVGEDGNDYRLLAVKDAIRQADYSKWYDELVKDYTEKLGFTSRFVKAISLNVAK